MNGTAPKSKHQAPQADEQQEPQDLWDALINLLQQQLQYVTAARDLQRQTQAVFAKGLMASPSVPKAPVGLPAPKHRTAAAAATKPDGKEEEGEKKDKNYENEMSLKQAVWHVLDRPEHAQGLKVSEIEKVIIEEGLWKSSSSDISNMVQGAVYNLKEARKVVRSNDRRYYIPEGATPPETRRGRKPNEETEPVEAK